MARQPTLMRAGRLVDIGGRRLHVEDEGEGFPAVLFEAGAGGGSSHWGEVPRRLAPLTRTLAYDRAGLGRSDRAPRRRTAGALAADVIALLDALGIREPVVLVGHSFGAALCRYVAHRHPHRVCGLVFVDGWHESMSDWERSRGLHSGPPRWLTVAAGIASRLRLWSALEAWREAESYDELDLANREAGRLSVPVRALVAGRMLTPAEAPRGYPVDEHNAAWVESSSRLARLSDDSRLTMVEDCDHHVALRKPQSVVDEIAGMLQERRARCPA